MKLSELNGKRICIWGAGSEGLAAYEALAGRIHASWSIYSDRPFADRELAALQSYPNISRASGEDFTALINAVDVVIKSPGVSLYSNRAQALRARNIAITSGSNIWFAEKPPGVMIGVTGTKGKSTTSSILHHIFQSLGHTSLLAGNIGRPLISLLDVQDTAYLVVELSSYQLADLTAEIDLGIILNVYAEHLDWHGSEDQYRSDKLNLARCISSSGTLITSQELLEQVRQLCDGRTLGYNTEDALFQVHGHGIRYETQLYPLSTAIFPGRHLLVNLQAVLTALHCLGFPVAEVMNSLGSFTPLPHRLTPIGSRNGVRFIDDSISTIPESSAAAVDSLAPAPCILILGGFDRGRDWDSVMPALCVPSVRAIVCTGQNGARIYDSLVRISSELETVPVPRLEPDFKKAVQKAVELAHPGDTVLLSPGSPSYDSFSSYIERGTAFRGLTIGPPAERELQV